MWPDVQSAKRSPGRRASKPDVPTQSVGIPEPRVDQQSPNPSFPDHQQPIARADPQRDRARLDFLDRVGLGYLTLDRPAGT